MRYQRDRSCLSCNHRSAEVLHCRPAIRSRLLNLSPLAIASSWEEAYFTGNKVLTMEQHRDLADDLVVAQAAQAKKQPAPVPSEPELLMDMCTAHWKVQAVCAVVKLGVMDVPGMSDSAVPIRQLAVHTSSNEDHLYRLMRYLAQYAIFEELPGQQFKLASLGHFLRADHPSGMRNLALTCGAPGHYMPWMHLDKAIKTGKSAFDFFQPDLPGGFFQYLALPAHKDEEDAFNKLMTSLTRTTDVGVATLHDFSSYRVVADIGGGYGHLLQDIMDTYPGVEQGIVFETPSVVGKLPHTGDKYKGRISWVEGDFFEAIPIKADAYVMKSILHDWDDQRCVTILSHLRASMPPGSVLVNFDRLLPDWGTPGFHPAKVMDINMLAMLSGKERTTQQWHDLMGRSGFTIRSITQTPNMAAIVAVAVPAAHN